ncbi:hypothetical protein NW762_013198 [Fusarium torreyae]|uniref:Uncharacterized protein n=1 Tax=Fusarium torreyae TaxID=1237075 RepID=A0A9W8RPU1_9HYPO|nr:hypothetical protein NW762_013198 [Fusarium torreyae]
MYRDASSQTPDRQDAQYVVYKTLQRLRLGACKGPYQDRDQILHQLRGLKEEKHRKHVLRNFAREPSRWKLSSEQQNQVFWTFGETAQSRYSTLESIIDCHNKSTAIYLFDPQRQAEHLQNGILKFLDVWLYRKWFKPYQSDIEHGRYIAKSMCLRADKDAAKPTIKRIAEFHMGLCQDLSADPFGRLPLEFLESLSIQNFSVALTEFNGGEKELLAALGRMYILQPLFKAVFIVLDETLGPTEGPFSADDINNIPVSLVHTGSTEGLSAPISFDVLHDNGDVLPGPHNLDRTVSNVRTTFKAALQFILDLERREMSDSGENTDMSLLNGSEELEKARELGWDESRHGKLPIDQPSSSWVDRCRYEEWTGAGALYHARCVSIAIRFLNATRKKCPLKEDWWWWDYA